MAKISSTLSRKIRHQRVRKKVFGSSLRPRLCVFRSLNHIYAQIIDDSMSKTIVSVSTLDLQIKDNIEKKTKYQTSELVGSLIARKALEKGIKAVVFDRGGYLYHGRVKALAESARKEGLLF
jgi:large subunit ribosomal protein L18